MMKTITIVVGAILCLTGLVGFIAPEFMRMALNPLHDVFLLLVGAITLYFGISGTEFQARNTCRVVGVLFALLGVATLLAGSGLANPGNVSLQADHVLKLIPGHLEYTTADGIRDLLTGILGLVAGFFPREKEIQVDMTAQQTKEKIAGGR
jgi:hypothetical protein